MIIAYFVYNILSRVIDVYYIFLGLYALLSWFPGAYHTFLGRTVRYFVEPFLRPIMQLKLRVGFLDLSVLVAFVILNIAEYLLAYLYSMWIHIL